MANDSVGTRPAAAMPVADEAGSGAVLVLVVAFAGTTMAQGGFYVAGRIALAVALLVAAVLAVGRRPTVSISVSPAAAGAGALVAWALARGVTSGQPAGGLATAAVVTGSCCAVVVCRRATAADHELLGNAVLSVAALVAVTGWVGVAVHHEPWALARGTTWRAASTLTYPNAAAALLVPAFLLAVARRVDRPSSRAHAASAAVLLAGLFATQSRGGVLALLVGSVVLAAFLGFGRVVHAVALPGLGALVATGGLLPGLGIDAAARPVPAIAALLAGTAVGTVPTRRAGGRRGRAVRGAVIGAVVVAVGVAVAWKAHRGSGLTLPVDRLTTGSSDRHGATGAALRVLVRHPIIGVGPGGLRVNWTDAHGVYSTRLVHDEYLQFAAELGLAGVAAAAVLVAGVGRWLRRARVLVPAWRWSGAVAGLAAFAVHSSLDFLWHIPALTFAAALLVGLAGGAVTDPPTTGSSPEAGTMQTKETL